MKIVKNKNTQNFAGKYVLLWNTVLWPHRQPLFILLSWSEAEASLVSREGRFFLGAKKNNKNVCPHSIITYFCMYFCIMILSSYQFTPFYAWFYPCHVLSIGVVR